MNTYMVVVNSKESEVRAYLGTLGECLEIFNNFFAVKSDESSIVIRDKLNEKLGDELMVFVMKSSDDGAWRVLRDASNWLKENI